MSGGAKISFTPRTTAEVFGQNGYGKERKWIFKSEGTCVLQSSSVFIVEFCRVQLTAAIGDGAIAYQSNRGAEEQK